MHSKTLAGALHTDGVECRLSVDREVKREIPGKMDKSPLLSWLLPAITTLLATFVGALLSYYFGVRAQLRIANSQKRQQIFGQLMGQKILRKQLYVSRFEALIYSDYHERKWKLAGHPKDSIDMQEAQRWMHKSEDLALEVARTNKDFLEIVGLVRALFQKTPELDALIDPVYHFGTPQLKISWDTLEASQLEPVKQKAVKDLHDFVDQEYGKPVDELLDYLARQLASDVK